MAHSPSSSPDRRSSYQSYPRPPHSPSCSPRAMHPPSATPIGFSSTSLATPLAIRGAPVNNAPPALPPPRHLPVVGLARPTFQQRHDRRDTQQAIPSHSSLGGGWNSPTQSRRPLHKSFGSLDLLKPVQGDMKPDEQSSRPPKAADEATQLPSFQELTRGHPLETHNHQKSLEAYDKQMKSKIGQLGRPQTPTGPLVDDKTSPVNGIRPLRLDIQPPFHRLTLAERPLRMHAHGDSPVRASPSWGARWGQSSQLGAVSPSVVSSSASTRSFSIADPRSPGSYEPSTAPSSLSAEHTTFSRFGSMDRGSNASLSLLSSAFDDSEREKSWQSLRRGGPEWSKDSRGSLDQALFPNEDESEFAAQGPPASRAHCANYQYQGLDASLPDMGRPQGVKRKASPSLGDTVANEPPPQATRSRTPGHAAKKTPPRQQTQALPQPYTVRSAASLQNLSCASQAFSPLAASNSASYIPPDHTSPGATASCFAETAEPSSRKPSYGTLTDPDSPVSALIPASVGISSSRGHDAAASACRPESGAVKNGRDGGIQAAHIHVCDCCPKKPKKFNTLEELQVHQREKQFYCTYCHNRFKNKNEAERHQNSLHLRKQSWSCAQLGNNIDRAFHACTATTVANPQQGPTPTSNLAEFDICGYCGKQFSNHPAPDWGERQKHLTDIHKFGECNQSKKFFRADHFRQHLKHSHQGQSGKWTNMLEQACVRDEPPPEPISQEQRQQASQALQAVQAASASTISPYQVEALQAANGATSLTARTAGFTSAMGSHIAYEPKIDEEDEGRG